MKKYCVIQTTFGKKSDAKKLAKILLEGKLTACAQISMIESFYFWKEKLTNNKEFLLELKTTEDLYKEIEKIILENHPYDLPQIIFLPIKNGFKSYFNWINDSTKNNWKN
jgi:periplasmic divalent cation tolerance protein